MQENFFKQPFGMNIKVPTRTITQFEQTAAGAVGGVFEPLFSFIQENQDVFTGDITKQIDRYNIMQYNIAAALRRESGLGDFDIQG